MFRECGSGMSLKRQAVMGIKWSAAAVSINVVSQFVQLVVLANVLEPADFGLFAIARIILGLAASVADVGINNAIIHSQTVTREQLSTLYWLNIGVGLCLLLVLFGSRQFFVNFYGEPALAPLFFWIGLNFVVSPIGHQFQSLMEKEILFREICFIQIFANLLSTCLAIACAFLDYGVFALVWGYLLRTIVCAFGFAIYGWCTWPPKFYFSFSKIRFFLEFGFYQMGERLVNYFSANVDYIIIGSFFGSTVLGVYVFAYELVLRPLQVVNPVVGKVAFPVFSKKQSSDDNLRYAYTELLKLLASIMVPIFVFVFFAAPSFVPLFFSTNWNSSVSLIQILCFVGFFKAIGNPSGAIILAKGRADLGFYWNIGVGLLNTVFFVVAAQYTAKHVALAYVAATILYSFLTAYIINRLIKLTYFNYVKAIAPAIFIGVGMSGVVYYSQCILEKVMDNQLLLLLMVLLFGFSTYVLLTLTFRRKYMFDISTLMRSAV